MSKFVKRMVMEDLSSRLEGVTDALLVDVMGMDANSTVGLRKRLREQNVNLLVVKKSLARRATEGTSLGPAFQNMEGSLAVIWGSEDIISLAKVVTELDEDKDLPEFHAKGGVMDGEQLSPEKVKEISKWPNRQQQLSILLGQILSPGAELSAQLLGPGANLASQLKQKSEGEDGEEGAETEAEAS